MAKKIPNLENFDLNLLQLFRHILTTKSISKAALLQRITQPAASNGLKRLRDALNDEVFIKTPDGMIPTDFAAAWARSIIPALEQIESSLSTHATFDPATWSGVFQFGVTDYIMEMVMYQALPELIRRAPLAQFRVIPMREREPHDDLSQGDLDLAVGSFFKVRSHFYQKLLGHDDFMVIMRKDHPHAQKKWNLDLYADTPQLLIAPWGRPHGVVDDILAEHKRTRTISLTVPYFNAAPIVIERTDLISTVPELMAQRWVKEYKIIAVKPPIRIPKFTLHMLWAERSLKNPAHEWVRQELAELAKKSFL